MNSLTPVSIKKDDRRGIPLLVVNPDGKRIWTWQCNHCSQAGNCVYLDGRVDFQRAVERFQSYDGTVVYACQHFMRELAEKLKQRGGRR